MARILAEPKLTTLSGREASLVVRDDKVGGTKLDVTPVVTDDGKIHVQHRVEIRKPTRAPGGRSAPSGQQVLTCCCAVDAESGKAVLGAPAIPWDADGKTLPVKIVTVVLRATAGTSSPDQSPSVVAASDGELRR